MMTCSEIGMKSRNLWHISTITLTHKPSSLSVSSLTTIRLKRFRHPRTLRQSRRACKHHLEGFRASTAPFTHFPTSFSPQIWFVIGYGCEPSARERVDFCTSACVRFQVDKCAKHRNTGQNDVEASDHGTVDNVLRRSKNVEQHRDYV
jgi:hypothetical protein